MDSKAEIPEKEQSSNVDERYRDEQREVGATDIKSYILRAVVNERLANDDIPIKIDLGAIGKEAERLMELSLRHPDRAEYGSIACTDAEGKRLFLLNKPVLGDAHSVPYPELPEGRLPATVIHTHPSVDTPFSPQDLEPLFIPPGHGKGVPAVLVATPSLKMMLLRTKETPFLSATDIFLHTATAWDAYGNREELDALYEEKDKSVFAALSNKRMYMIKEMADYNKIKMYACPITSNIAIRAE